MFSVSLTGADEAGRKFDAFPAALAAALNAKAGELGQALVDKVKDEKLSGAVLQAKSGALRASIAAQTVIGAEGVDVTVGSFGALPYAAIQEYGGKTGAHEILPSKAGVLAFVGEGRMRFARRIEHPGSVIPERSYLRSSLEEMPAPIAEAFREAFEDAWRST